MSRGPLTIPPLLVFTDPANGTWGIAAGEQQAQVAVGDLSGAPQFAPAAIDREAGSGMWALHGEAGDLTTSTVTGAVTGPDDDGGLSPVEVSGTLLGTELESDAAGVLFGGRPEAKADSLRLVCARFADGRTIAMLALRPSGAKGHDRDEVSVVCLGEREGVTVFDPRLSSTYGGDGRLRRVGTEMWLGDDEERDLYSLRMAGEAGEATATLQIDGLQVQAQPFACHSRGDAGLGVYALLTRP